ncbi:hypothetical protein L226DRAFT_104974 [Lentinus tigrinus ALCF2SS1-7]|uniref:Uncharacterized protein n=1 Tax=Lentinus tigrinus ALCF2SS1-6 TaxID=1328759 RepID=A0A5C2S7M8_9APHY|nr:hypothetical protein L227DRAFT_168770 [Lentinus tigrinus ALCF2SS1-6]RPD73644.1 hypothetical protein L226DRAFT_104974 [Lentinus tigrinus ALCF2SS1-7]
MIGSQIPSGSADPSIAANGQKPSVSKSRPCMLSRDRLAALICIARWSRRINSAHLPWHVSRSIPGAGGRSQHVADAPARETAISRSPEETFVRHRCHPSLPAHSTCVRTGRRDIGEILTTFPITSKHENHGARLDQRTTDSHHEVRRATPKCASENS